MAPFRVLLVIEAWGLFIGEEAVSIAPVLSVRRFEDLEFSRHARVASEMFNGTKIASGNSVNRDFGTQECTQQTSID